MSKPQTVLLAVLTVVIVGLAAAIIFLAVVPGPDDRFTEFYLLNSDGKASDYPSDLSAGQSATVTIGVVNHEGGTASYRIQVTDDGAIINSIETGPVQDSQTWKKKVSFTLNTPGDNRTVAFQLFLTNESVPHIKDPLLLRLNVIGKK